MTEDDVLRILLETAPTDRSPYGINGYPPVWPVITDGDRTLFIHPKRVLANAQGPEVPGYVWQWKRGDNWQDQAHAVTWAQLEQLIAAELASGAQPAPTAQDLPEP